MENSLKQKTTQIFRAKFGTDPIMLVQAPGRVNIIGEHTDYSGGFVLPMAIDLGIVMAIRPRSDGKIQVFSLDFDENMAVDLSDFSKTDSGWTEYIKAIVWALKAEGISLTGWDGVFMGNIPIGAGLSSSAALENATALAFSLTSDFSKTPKEYATLAQKAENEWVGVSVGIMDQLISAAGKEDYALLIDCRSVEYEFVKIPTETTFMVLDTMTRRELTNSNYNERREECERASKILNVDSLRDVSKTILFDNRTLLDPVLYKRVKHFVNENERVLMFSQAMKDIDLNKMGKLLNESHISLRDDYEVSSKELDIMVEIAQRHAHCLGARMTGAGFGGCALALLESSEIESFTAFVYAEYFSATGIKPNIFRVDSANGMQVLKMEEIQDANGELI